MRAYIEIAKKAYSRNMAYRANYFFWIAGSILSVCLMVYLWTALYSHRQEVAGINLRQMVTYAVLAELTSWMLWVETIWKIRERIRSGDVSLDLIRPVDYPTMMFADEVGTLLFSSTRVIPGFAILIVVFRALPPASAHNGVLFALSLLFAYGVSFGSDLFVALFGFWTLETVGLWEAKTIITYFISGMFVPLWFFPKGVQRVVSVLPFGMIYHVPLSIYIGKLAGREAWNMIGLQIFWLVVTLISVRWIWRLARKHVLVQGG
jgi:ABC-2 type transport system permease protein